MKKTTAEQNLIVRVSSFNAKFDTIKNHAETLINAADKALSGHAERSSVANASDLKKVRVETLKAYNALSELEQEYTSALGLDFVGGVARDKLLDVADARNKICEVFFNLSQKSSHIRDAIERAVKPADNLQLLNELSDKVSNLISDCSQTVLNMPEVGMTFGELKSLSAAERKMLRPAGRPKAPIEVQMMKAERVLLDHTQAASILSNGKLDSVDKIIDGVQLSNRGRPQISELAQKDRTLNKLIDRLETLAAVVPESDADSIRLHDQKLNRLKVKIDKLREEIRDGESELTGVKLYYRKLEQLRAQHRDLATAEIKTKGAEQVRIVMKLLQNECDQLPLVNQILKDDPEARITVTHKVNPKATRDRFNRLRLHGKLKESQLERLNSMQETLENYTFARKRGGQQ